MLVLGVGVIQLGAESRHDDAACALSRICRLQTPPSYVCCCDHLFKFDLTGACLPKGAVRPRWNALCRRFRLTCTCTCGITQLSNCFFFPETLFQPLQVGRASHVSHWSVSRLFQIKTVKALNSKKAEIVVKRSLTFLRKVERTVLFDQK